MRADLLLVARGLFDSRAKAQAAIAAGKVTADGAPVRKPSDTLPTGAAIAAEPAHPYVSRGGVKLAAALDRFGFDPNGRVCLDVGSSTGGFTQVLLERGASRIYAADVGRGQLDHRIAQHKAVLAFEETDVRQINPALLVPLASFIAIDVSFISLKLVMPAALALAARPAELVALIKPQFEAGRAHLKKGIVRDPAVHALTCDEISAFLTGLGWRVTGLMPSPIDGGDGNREFLIGAVSP
jgi:23S rRNA (cytidine1920-2'-O)/16S rRNA (cytidine1409-2'-O)-methyltransferase